VRQPAPVAHAPPRHASQRRDRGHQATAMLRVSSSARAAARDRRCAGIRGSLRTPATVPAPARRS
jgi:hypothetical protein